MQDARLASGDYFGRWPQGRWRWWRWRWQKV